MKVLSTSATVVWAIACLLGFIWQVVEVSKIYFKYDVVTQVQTEVSNVIEVPALHVCYSYVDILDYDRLNHELKTNWSSKAYDSNYKHKLRHSLTVRQILQFTPSESDAFTNCMVRKPQSYASDGMFISDCRQMFTITKFVFLEFICYKYQYSMVNGINFSMHQVANTPDSPGLIFWFSPGKQFERMIFTKFMATKSDTFPYKEMSISPAVYKASENISILGLYSVTTFTLTKNRLAPPFTTNCFNYSTIDRKSKVACHQECVKNLTLIHLKKIPFSSIEFKAVDDRILSYIDVMNQTVAKLLFESYEKCGNKCKRYDCNEITTFSRIQFRRGPHFGQEILSPIEPSVIVIFKEVLQTAEYMTYVLSCFGTWFGLSVISLNPVINLKSLIIRITSYRNSSVESKTGSESDLRKEFRIMKLKIAMMEQRLKSHLKREPSVRSN